MENSDLEEVGYTEIYRVRENGRSIIFFARSSDGLKVLKVTEMEHAAEWIHCEVAFNQCMQREGNQAPFVVPRSHFIAKPGLWIGEFEKLDAAWFDSDLKAEDDKEPFDVFMRAQVYLAMRHIALTPLSEVPRILTNGYGGVAQRHLAFVSDMRTWVRESRERDRFLGIWDEVDLLLAEAALMRPSPLGLSHRDLLPKNMGRLRDGHLAIIDAEFATWDIRWIDVATTFLEMYIREDRKSAAQSLLRDILFHHRQEGGDVSEFLFPLVYKWCWYLHQAVWKTNYLSNVVDMFKLLCTLDLQVMCAP